MLRRRMSRGLLKGISLSWSKEGVVRRVGKEALIDDR